MTESGSELRLACDLLRQVKPTHAARVRVLRSMESHLLVKRRTGIRLWTVAALGLGAASAAALGLELSSIGSAPGPAPCAKPASSARAAKDRTPAHRGRPLRYEELRVDPAPSSSNDSEVAPRAIGKPRIAGRSAEASERYPEPARRLQNRDSVALEAPTPPTTAFPAVNEATGARSVARSELSEQVAAYQAAVGLVETAPAQALAQLGALRTRWPNCPLRHEIDLRIVQVLVATGRRTEAEREGRAFILRYPNSPRRADVQALVAP